MQILDIPRKVPPRARFIEIPLYHRAHLSLAHNSQLHICYLPAGSLGEPAVLQPQLVASPFPFQAWDRIWRLTAYLTDRHGLVADLCDILSQRGINLLLAESGAALDQRLHSIELLFEATDPGRVPSSG